LETPLPIAPRQDGAQPARPASRAKISGIEKPWRVLRRLPPPEPAQGDGRQDAGHRRSVRGCILPLEPKPGIDRQYLRRWPDLASRRYLGTVVQASQDAGLAQVARQQQAPGLQMGDTSDIRIQLAAFLASDPA
jgi:hypothetical protein